MRRDEIILSEDLRYWRAERPSEWMMDEFIRKAEALEARLDRLADYEGMLPNVPS